MGWDGWKASGNFFKGIGKGISQSWDAITGQAQANAMKDANQQNLDLQKEQWAREDTSVQRGVADMKAAGLNPLSAAGPRSEPSSPPGGLVKPVTPANPVGNIAGLAGTISSLVGGIVSVQQTMAQTALTQAQTKNTASRTVGQDLGNELASSLNPLKKTSMEMQVAFDKENNPQKLALIKAAIAGTDAATAVKQVDVQAKKVGIDFTKQSTALLKIKQDLARQDLSIGEQDLAARLIAIKAAGLQLEILKGLQATAPGLADGIRKWIGLGSDALDLAGKVGNMIDPSGFKGGRR